jgi:hypothetical protein
VAFWACSAQFNPAYATRDPTRRPCVLYITQENSRVETLERMLSYAHGATASFAGVPEDDMVRALGEAFSSETCAFSFKFRPSRSISPADIDAMIYDEWMAGYEVVMVVHDYIKRLKADEQFGDARHLELGSIVDGLHIIAEKYGVPVMTGMQLNRAAYTAIDAALKAGKLDGVKDLGAGNVGESINVFENADVVLFQGRMVVESLDAMYLTVKRGKMRGRSLGGPDFFAQPFDQDADGNINEMRLAEDAHLPKRGWRGRTDLSEGIAAEYDANGGGPGPNSQERRTARTASRLGGDAAAQPRRAPSGPAATLTVVPEPAASTNYEGL